MCQCAECTFAADVILMYFYVLFLGLIGPHEEIDYSAKLKFSDDEGEEEGEEERSESKNDLQYVAIQYIQCVCVCVRL